MSEIKNKLDALSNTKEGIKNAIIEIGGEVSETDTFRSYTDKISNLIDTTIISQSVLDDLVESAIKINGQMEQYTLKLEYLVEDNIISSDTKTYTVYGSSNTITAEYIKLEKNTDAYDLSSYISVNNNESTIYFKLVDSSGKIAPYPIYNGDSSSIIELSYTNYNMIPPMQTGGMGIQSIAVTDDVKYIIFAASLDELNSMFNM